VKKFDFFFDLSSPYSYLAATQLDALTERTQSMAHWRPVVLGAVFKAAENVMPGANPTKARYMLRDLKRWARRYAVPFKFASRFPMNAIKAERLICAAELAQGYAAAAKLGRSLFDSLWVEDQDLNDVATLRACCQRVGLPADELLAATETQPVKDKLRANTDEAIARGMFGAPSFFVGDDHFWGNDRLEFVEAALKEAKSG
jgi:2-hydroxychromene-2-carboxylate isomerase